MLSTGETEWKVSPSGICLRTSKQDMSLPMQDSTEAGSGVLGSRALHSLCDLCEPFPYDSFPLL